MEKVVDDKEQRLEELRGALERLLRLVREPELGVSTWYSAYDSVAGEVIEKLNRAGVKCQRVRP